MSDNNMELRQTMQKTNARHRELRGAYVSLLEQRAIAEEMLEDGSVDVNGTRLRVESEHARQTNWYVILFLTMLLFSKFALQSASGATDIFSTALLAVVVVLFVTLTGLTSTPYSGAAFLMAVIMSLVVAVYSAHYVNNGRR